MIKKLLMLFSALCVVCLVVVGCEVKNPETSISSSLNSETQSISVLPPSSSLDSNSTIVKNPETSISSRLNSETQSISVLPPSSSLDSNSTISSDSGSVETSSGEEGLFAEIVSAEGFEIVDDKLNMTVTHEVTSFDFKGKIEIPTNCKYLISENSNGTNVIISKTVDLNYGENKVYLFVIDKNDDDNQKVYTVTIYRKKSFTVDFKVDGLTVKSETVAENEYATAPSVTQEKEGYTFDGWDFDYKNTKITENVTANAKWKIIECTITYVLDGGTNSADNKETFTINDLGFTLNPATKKDFCFVGWYLDSEFKTACAQITELKNVTVYAQYYEQTEGLTFASVSGGYEVTGYTGVSENVLIPNLYLGLPVLSISAESFISNSNIQRVKISNGVLSIGDSAFDGCKSLQSVTIPNSVQSIGKYAFDGCNSLQSVTIPNSVQSIGNNAFIRCEKLVEVYNLSALNITKGLTDYGYVGYYALDVYTSLETPSKLSTDENGFVIHTDGANKTLVNYVGTANVIETPNGVTSIYKNTFKNNGSLQSVKIANGVSSIGQDAFNGCGDLQNVVIPSDIQTIGSDAFLDCDNLQFNDYNNGSYLGNESNQYVVLVKAKNKDITSCQINSNTKIIYRAAFSDCDSLQSITIGGNVLLISDSAFSNCSGLRMVIIQDSVNTIGGYAFFYSSNLESVVIGNGVQIIGSNAFYLCSNLKHVYYSGTSAEWEELEIGNRNDELLNATIYYYSETAPIESGNFWRYVNGVATAW